MISISVRYSSASCAVSGAGANTKKLHIPNLQKIDGVQVVAVANRSLESAQKAAKEFHIAKVVFTSMQVLTAFLHFVIQPRQCSLSAAVVMTKTVLKLLTSTHMHATHTLVVLVTQKQCLCVT